MSNNDYKKLDLDTSIVFRESRGKHRLGNSDCIPKFAKAIVFTALLSSTNIADANSSYNEEISTTSVSLTSFNKNFLVKSSFSSIVPNDENSSFSIDDEEYDEIEEVLSSAHPEGKVKEVKIRIIGHERGSISIPDFFVDFDYE